MSHPQSYTAYRFEELHGKLVKVDVQWRDPAPGELVAKVIACGICGSDDAVPTQFLPTGFPRIPGHEIVGDVVAIAPGEKHYKVGDRIGAGWHGGHCGHCARCQVGDFMCCESEDITGIFRDGGYAEYVTLRTESICPVPKDMDPAEVAPLLCAGVTTFNSLRHMKVRPGDVVAVQGIGGLGHLALQYSRSMGYRTVALSSGPAKKELAHQLGAHDYIDGSQVDQAKALNELGGAKVIICTAPSSKVIQSLIPGLAVEGQLLMLALPSDAAELNLATLIGKRQSIIGWPSGAAKDIQDTVEYSRLQNIKCLVQTFPLEKAQEAYDHRGSARFRAVLLP